MHARRHCLRSHSAHLQRQTMHVRGLNIYCAVYAEYIKGVLAIKYYWYYTGIQQTPYKLY